MVEAACSSKSLVMIYHTTWCHIPGDSNFYIHCHENFKSYISHFHLEEPWIKSWGWTLLIEIILISLPPIWFWRSILKSSVVFQILPNLLFISLKFIVFVRLRANTLNLKLLKQIIIPKLCSFSSFSHCNYEDCVHIQILDLLVSFGEMKLYKYSKCFDSSWSCCWCWQYLCY